jgi:hypothetical protein
MHPRSIELVEITARIENIVYWAKPDLTDFELDDPALASKCDLPEDAAKELIEAQKRLDDLVSEIKWKPCQESA